MSQLHVTTFPYATQHTRLYTSRAVRASKTPKTAHGLLSSSHVDKSTLRASNYRSFRCATTSRDIVGGVGDSLALVCGNTRVSVPDLNVVIDWHAANPRVCHAHAVEQEVLFLSARLRVMSLMYSKI